MGWIDPSGRRDRWWFGREPFEALRMCGKGRHQGGSALHGELIRVAVVHSVGSHQADSAMAVNGVVPTEEHLAMSPGIFDRAEARREVGPVLERLELGEA